MDGFTRDISCGNVFNVAALITIRWPVLVGGVLSLCSSLHRQREIIDLLSGVVVVELTLHRPAGRF